MDGLRKAGLPEKWRAPPSISAARYVLAIWTVVVIALFVVAYFLVR